VRLSHVINITYIHTYIHTWAYYYYYYYAAFNAPSVGHRDDESHKARSGARASHTYIGLLQGRGVDPMCFSGSGPTHFFRSRVWIGIGPTHFLRWIVYYCVCIQHDIDKSQISFIELCKTLRTNNGLRAINSCLHLFWPQLCKACWVKHCFVTAEFKIFISRFHQQTVEFGPTHIFTQIYAPASRIVYAVWLKLQDWTMAVRILTDGYLYHQKSNNKVYESFAHIEFNAK